jgi:hypothetical protein
MVGDDQPGSDPGTEEDGFSVSLEVAAGQCGISVATLYKRIQAGTLAARQEPGGRRRWMLRPSDVAALEAKQRPGSAVGEWSHDLVALFSEQFRQLEATQVELRELERRAVRLEADNVTLRSQVRDLQSVLAATWRALTAAMGEAVNVLTMPDTAND